MQISMHDQGHDKKNKMEEVGCRICQYYNQDSSVDEDKTRAVYNIYSHEICMLIF